MLLTSLCQTSARRIQSIRRKTGLTRSAVLNLVVIAALSSSEFRDAKPSGEMSEKKAREDS